MQPSTIDEVLLHNEDQCEKAIESFRRDLQKIRTGRASASILEGVDVDYYGARTPLTHLGQVSSPEARLLIVQVFDAAAVEAVEKAIRSSDLGFNPSRDGNTLRINVPTLTEESRKEIVRHLHKMAEDKRVSVRNHRRDANDYIKKFEKNGEITKDDAKRTLDDIQKITDRFVKEVDKLLSAKEAECMEV